MCRLDDNCRLGWSRSSRKRSSRAPRGRSTSMPGPTGPATRAHRRTRALPRAACNADPPQNQRFLSGLKLWSEGGDDLVTHNQKPGAPEALCCRGIGLGEFLEQLRLLLRHADVGVGDGEFDPVATGGDPPRPDTTGGAGVLSFKYEPHLGRSSV